jgi:hypothetical protein
MKKITLLSVLFSITIALMAQNPADLAKTQSVQETQDIETEMVEYPEDVLRNTITSVLDRKGKMLSTINDDGSIYVIGSATTARPSNMTGFVNSRDVAYNIAELTAKMELLRMAGEQISSGRGFTMLEEIVEGDDPDAKVKASRLEKAGRIVDESLDKALEHLGVSEDEINDMNESQKKASYEQNFNQTIKSLVAGMVKGCAVVMVAEGDAGGDDYQIAVCLKYSPEYQSLAALIKNNGDFQYQIGDMNDVVEKINNMPESKLVGKFGALVKFNSEGGMIVFGFGQQEVRTTSSRQSAAFSRAYSQARLKAVNNIKNFVAEDIVAQESMESVEKLKEYDDGTNAYFSKQKWEQAVKSKESTLNLPTHEVRKWKSKHPVSGHNIAGVVVAWTPADAKRSKELNNQLNSSKQGDDKSKKPAIPRKQTKKSNITISGEEEDI